MTPASGRKNGSRLSNRPTRQLSLYGDEKPAYFVTGRRSVPARPDNEIEQLRRFCLPERGSGLAMQIAEPGGNFPDQE